MGEGHHNSQKQNKKLWKRVLVVKPTKKQPPLTLVVPFLFVFVVVRLATTRAENKNQRQNIYIYIYLQILCLVCYTVLSYSPLTVSIYCSIIQLTAHRGYWLYCVHCIGVVEEGLQYYHYYCCTRQGYIGSPFHRSRAARTTCATLGIYNRPQLQRT